MKVEAEKITPYQSDQRKKGAQVREMFDNIAPTYDFMNRAMTLGIDKVWRNKAVKMLKEALPKPDSKILDIATGTGDLAMLLARKLPQAIVHGVDLSEGMVEIGKHKIKAAGLDHRIELSIADCMNLPFESNSFQAITAAFGVRNFEHLSDGYQEMHRVLAPGGTLCVIELSTPTGHLTRPLYNLYARHIIPAIGKLISKDTRAYSYLPESIAAVPQGESMLQLIREAGFDKAIDRRLTFGTCSIYLATKS